MKKKTSRNQFTAGEKKILLAVVAELEEYAAGGKPLSNYACRKYASQMRRISQRLAREKA